MRQDKTYEALKRDEMTATAVPSNIFAKVNSLALQAMVKNHAGSW